MIGDMHVLLLFGVVALSVMKPALGFNSGVGDATIRCMRREREALLQFKQHLIDDKGVLSSWGSEEDKKDCCQWRGVQCSNFTGHVVVLDLHGSRPDDYYLRGEKISSSTSLIGLQHLRHLDLSGNAFEGSYIPKSIAFLSRLQYLNLSGAGFLGTVPYQFGNLSRLWSLDLSENFDLKAEKLEWLSHLSSLRSLNLQYANLSEARDYWVEAISRLPSLTYLNLASCGLPLTNPALLPQINSSASLAILDLSDNDLTFSIYTRLFNSTTSSLVHLDLSNNKLEGLIPNEPFGDMNSLAYLDLSSNKLQGLIPDIFGGLNSLQFLDLSWNKLEGGVSKSLGNLTTLQTLRLLGNNFTQQLPDFLRDLFGGAEKSSLEILNLEGNQFSGSLPDITKFSSLKDLSLALNQLNGSFPGSFGHLSNLTALDLSQNQITGPLPDLTMLSSLRVLDISHNRLNGSMTESIGQLFQLQFLDASSNSLKGIISDGHLSGLSNLQYLDLSFNLLVLNFSSDWIPPFNLEHISLCGCQLGPQFPSWLQGQSTYAELDISHAGIEDAIPDWFWKLSPHLNYLNLSYNHINGTIPDLSSKVTYHPKIDLSHNRLEGPIPKFIPNVTSLYLSDNRFSGSISFLCAMNGEFLGTIDLSNNQLSGELPDCWMHLKELVVVNLANNSFSGKMPSSIGSLYQLGYLNLRNNDLNGELPLSLKNCQELRIIDVGRNKFSGKIPDWIGTHLMSLIVVSLRVNRFSGSMPLSLCHLNHIQLLDISQNCLSGIIPQCFNNFTALIQRNSSEEAITLFHTDDDGSYYENSYLADALLQWKGQESMYKNTLGLLSLIDLSSNKLVGKIPEEISYLTELVSLNLSRNDLTGNIIQKIGELKLLETLDLSWNQLSGEIPAGIASLNFLSVLDLSNNNLSGKIPSSTQLQGFNASAYTGNRELCGLPLLRKCPGDEIEIAQDPFLAKSNNGEDGIVNKEFYVSMGLGFGVGFGGVFSTLLLKRSWGNACFKLLKIISD